MISTPHLEFDNYPYMSHYKSVLKYQSKTKVKSVKLYRWVVTAVQILIVW